MDKAKSEVSGLLLTGLWHNVSLTITSTPQANVMKTRDCTTHVMVWGSYEGLVEAAKENDVTVQLIKDVGDDEAYETLHQGKMPPWQPRTEAERPKVIVICGSSRFCRFMAVVAWLLEVREGAIVMALHLLPNWYWEEEADIPPDHLAEDEGVAEDMDALHLRKIDMCDEIFVLDREGYIGDSTRNEIAYAKKIGKPIRYYRREPVSNDVEAKLEAHLDKIDPERVSGYDG